MLILLYKILRGVANSSDGYDINRVPAHYIQLPAIYFHDRW